MGFPHILTRWIQVLYKEASARVRIGGLTSTPLPIERGTSQGCPLSPILFALILEPLACKIRHHKAGRAQFLSPSNRDFTLCGRHGPFCTQATAILFPDH